jgi:hypothetical protein
VALLVDAAIFLVMAGAAALRVRPVPMRSLLHYHMPERLWGVIGWSSGWVAPIPTHAGGEVMQDLLEFVAFVLVVSQASGKCRRTASSARRRRSISSVTRTRLPDVGPVATRNLQALPGE